MIPIALFKKFLSLQFIMSVEVRNIVRCSSKTNELRDIDSIGYRASIITSKTSRSIMDNYTSKNAALVSEVLALLSWSSERYI